MFRALVDEWENFYIILFLHHYFLTYLLLNQLLLFSVQTILMFIILFLLSRFENFSLPEFLIFYFFYACSSSILLLIIFTILLHFTFILLSFLMLGYLSWRFISNLEYNPDIYMSIILQYLFIALFMPS